MDIPPSISAAESLSYAINDPALHAPWMREKRFRWLPSLAIAILALLLFDTIYLLSEAEVIHAGIKDIADNLWGYWTFPVCAAFLPLFVKRRGWLRLVICFPICLALFFLFHPMDAAGHPLDQNFWYALVCAGTLLLLALCWHGTAYLHWPGFILAALALAGMLGLAMLLLLDGDYLWFIHWEWPITASDTEQVDAFLIRYVFLILLWAAMAWLGSKTLRRLRLTGSLVAFLGVAICAAGITEYLTVLRMRLIVYLMPTEPAHQYRDYDYLASHTISTDDALSMLERASWDSTWTIAAKPTVVDIDWRLQALNHLPDDAPTAQRLGGILAAHPTLALADLLAERLGRHHAYVAAPVLLQYALFENRGNCSKALIAMSVPQVGWAVLYHSAPGTATNRVNNQLSAIYRMDVHDESWTALVKSLGHGRRSPVPDEICDQCDAVVSQFERYLDATNRALIQLRRYPASAVVDMGIPPGDALYVADSRATFAIAAGIKEPDGKAGRLDALTREVDRYVADVDHFLHPPPPPHAPSAGAAGPATSAASTHGSLATWQR